MYKDYKEWMKIKSEIHNGEAYLPGYKEREIRVCNLGENIGFEEDGKGRKFVRPVLILKVFNKYFCHIIPLSTAKKKGKYFYPFDGRTGKISVALLSQSRSIDSSRLHRKIGMISEENFIEIKQKIKETLF